MYYEQEDYDFLFNQRSDEYPAPEESSSEPSQEELKYLYDMMLLGLLIDRSKYLSKYDKMLLGKG
jgi:hypothetical protein